MRDAPSALLTVIGKDRPGIIASVTGILFRYGCNLEDISMTVLEGEFAMILVVRFGARTSRNRLEHACELLEKKTGLTFFWKAPKGSLVRGERPPKSSTRYLVSAVGRDQTGIVHKVSRLLARHGLNITDLNSKILGRGRWALYSLLLEVDIPKSFPVRRLEHAFARLGRKLDIDLCLKPVERIEF